MTTRFVVHTAVAAAIAFAVTASLQAQSVTLPPDGNNPKASASLSIGLVEVGITYNSPKVPAPTAATARAGIWGQLVPYGMAMLGFGTCGANCPWRGGANENTVFAVSHDVEVEGQKLPAGPTGCTSSPARTHGRSSSQELHGVGQLLLRRGRGSVRVRSPVSRRVHTMADIRLHRPRPRHARVALRWERLQVPWTIRVPDVTALWVADAARGDADLAGVHLAGGAAQFCLQNKVNLDEALGWAQAADPLAGGQENFTTLLTVADLQAATDSPARPARSGATGAGAPDRGGARTAPVRSPAVTRGRRGRA